MFSQKPAQVFLPKLILVVSVLVSIGALIGAVGYLIKYQRVDFYSCSQDSDCISVNGGCCDCSAGGTATAINKNLEKQWKDKLAKECKDIYCIQMISNDPSCFKEPKCLNNKCVLEEPEREVDITTDKTEYERGESITIEIKNISSEEKFITYPSIDKFENGEWIPIKFVWSGCWVSGGLPYLPLELNESFDYPWDQKEKWCSDNPKDLNIYSKSATSGKYRIKSVIVEKTRSEKDDPNNIFGKPSDKFIFSNEFTIKEKSAVDPRCGQKVKFNPQCPIARIVYGYEFDTQTNKCLEINAGGGCSLKTPFNSLEECQEVCENKKKAN